MRNVILSDSSSDSDSDSDAEPEPILTPEQEKVRFNDFLMKKVETATRVSLETETVKEYMVKYSSAPSKATLTAWFRKYKGALKEMDTMTLAKFAFYLNFIVPIDQQTKLIKVGNVEWRGPGHLRRIVSFESKDGKLVLKV
ncbi:hypothetical protein CAEBREN_18181 [Caenorhabditis brenneri]|uniref:SPK domain-containing protein n=1 Tax=Caenorhabditis brenneri TaxID=135651 RepID=G0ND86_CAEBE|nr:hypothetical protein CAEBREN_18181 [Caenorhabditis brenneri]